MMENWSQLMKKINTDAQRNNVPVSGQFELTARCNLKCKMCYVCEPDNAGRISLQELSAKEWIKIAEEAKNAGMLHLLLTGGEVFVRKDFREIYEALSSMGFYIKIYTNGTLINPEIAKWLGKDPPDGMELTLYGASPETYRKVTGNPEAFKRAVNGLDLLLSEGIRMTLRTTVIRDNSADYDGILAIADQRRILLKFVYCVTDRRGEHNIELGKMRLPPDEIAQYEMRSQMDYAKRVPQFFPEKSNTEELDNDDKENLWDFPFKCSAGKSSFWITWDGKMSPCAISDDYAANPVHYGFNKAWRELSSICNKIPSCKKCMDCSQKGYCWTCPARLKLETGSYEKPSEYFCEWAKFREKNLLEAKKVSF